jgi:phage shock protein E
MRAPLLPIVVALSLGSCTKEDSTTNTPETNARTPQIETERAAAAIADGAVVVDVRSQKEFEGNALEGAQLVPHDQIADRVAEVEAWNGGKSGTVVVYCGSGGRAQKAKDALEAAGFTAVINGGGLEELQIATGGS